MPPLIDEFKWDRGLAAGAFSFGFLFSAIVSPFVGRVVDARGPRIVIWTGVAFMKLMGLSDFADAWPKMLSGGMLTTSNSTLRHKGCRSSAKATRRLRSSSVAGILAAEYRSKFMSRPFTCAGSGRGGGPSSEAIVGAGMVNGALRPKAALRAA